MPIVCWGNLAKSADDTQRIEQSIQAYMEEHNENVNAHQIEGSSLYMHRLNEELDHRFGSIDQRYLAANKVSIASCFESLDGWQQSGNCYAGILCGEIRTGAVNGNTAMLRTETSLSTFKLDYTKNPFFQTTFFLTYDTSQHVYVVAGSDPDVSSGDAFGFKVVNGNLYAYWTIHYVEHTSLISGITLTNINVYRAQYITATNTLEFYVNGVLEHTTTASLPGYNDDTFFTYNIITDTNAARAIRMIDFLWQQDR
jgi:hypothetical protein